MTDNWTHQVDHYTPGKSVLIELANRRSKLDFDRTAGSKVEFRKADNSLVEATDYSLIGRSQISAQVPAAVTGIIHEVVVTMMINGSLRSGSYTTPLTA